jgi:hypothetical protein
VGEAGVQLEGGGLVIQAVVGIGRVRLFGWRRNAWVAGAAGRGRGLGADDVGRTVGLADVRERDLRRVTLAVAFSRVRRIAVHHLASASADARDRSLTCTGG